MRHKKAKRVLPKKIVKTLDIPEDVIFSCPRITLMANTQIRIENYKSILEYEREKITLCAKDMLIGISGDKLDIEVITDDEVLIDGEILSIDFSKVRS